MAMDLSHLDISKTFTMYDAACAAVGIDPRAAHLASPQEMSRANHIAREMIDPVFAAEEYVRINSASLDREEQAPQCRPLALDIWGELISDEEEGLLLMSVQLESLVVDRNRTGGKVDLLKMPEELAELLFSRQELARWFDARGFKPVYQFIKPSVAVTADIVNESNEAAAKRPLFDDINPRTETSYLNIIGALIDSMLGTTPGGRQKSVYATQSAIIDAILSAHPDKPGLSKRNLEGKFAKALSGINQPD